MARLWHDYGTIILLGTLRKFSGNLAEKIAA